MNSKRYVSKNFMHNMRNTIHYRKRREKTKTPLKTNELNLFLTGGWLSVRLDIRAGFYGIL